MAISAKKAIEAAKGSKGFVVQIAQTLGVSRKHVYELMEKYPEFKQAIIDEREAIKDFAESQLLRNIAEGKETSLIFYLKTQGKDRGYIERQELTGADGSELRIKVVYEGDSSKAS